PLVFLSSNLWMQAESLRVRRDLGASIIEKRLARMAICRESPGPSLFQIAGWSSLVARQAHNLKVVGSNPAPATPLKAPESLRFRGFFFVGLGRLGAPEKPERFE